MSSNNPLILREYLNSRFSLTELKIIASELGISYEHLHHDTTPKLVLDLITYCQHEKILPELRAAALEIRPEEREILLPPLLKSGPGEGKLGSRCPRPPAAPAVFGGREAQLADLKQMLKSGQTTAVHGLGGIGKTTLAYQAANELFEEGVFKAVLHASLGREANEVTVRGLLEGWAQSADRTFASNTPLDSLVTLVKNCLQELMDSEGGGGPTLVLLDDVWEKGLQAARWLLQAAPSPCTVLLTSRAANLMTTLGARQRISLEGLSPAEGVALLGQYLPGVSVQARHALTTVLHGYTLAVVLAAKRAIDDNPDQPEAGLARHLAQYATGLRDGTPFDKLELKREGSDQKQDSLTVTLFHSYKALKTEEQVAFRALGVLAYDEPFDEPMLAATWQLEPEEAARRARRLRLLSLLQSESNKGEGWYSQHPVLHSYARALLKEKAAEAATALACYDEHITRIAGQFDTLKPWEWQPLTPYLAHVQAVGAGLVAQYEAAKPTPDESLAHRASDFADSITSYLHYRREVREEGWLHLGLEASRQLQQPARERLFLSGLGSYYNAAGEKQKALQYHEQSLIICREQKDQENEAATLNNIGLVYKTLGENERALEYYEQALPLLRAVGDRGGEAATLNNIGAVYANLGENERALEYYEQALPIHRAVGNRNMEATTLNNIGLVYANLGENERALEYYEQALPIHRAVGNRNMEATTLNNIGLVYKALGEKAKALNYYEQALPLRRAVGDRGGEAVTLYNIGAFLAEQGDLAGAISKLEQALTLFQQVQSPDVVDVERWLALIRAAAGSS